MNIELLLYLLMLGAVVGVLAGLLGIGGGLIIVPALLLLLPMAQIDPEIIMNIALATSLTSIIVSSGSSALNHLKRGNVDMFAVKWLIPGVVIGGLMGTYVVEWVPSQYLPHIFGVIVLLLALQMLLSLKPKTQRSMPSPLKTVGYGAGIGIISSFAGVGGGSLSVPFLNGHGVEMRRAVGSSSVCGCVIALAGAVGFIIHGTGHEHLPPYSLGYIYLPALAAISVTSMFTTRIGVNLAIRLPTQTLKKIFAVFLIFVAGTMLLH